MVRTIARVGWKVVLTIYALLNIAGLPDNAQDLRAYLLPLGPHVGRIVGIVVLLVVLASLVPAAARQWLWSQRPWSQETLPTTGGGAESSRQEPSPTAPTPRQAPKATPSTQAPRTKQNAPQRPVLPTVPNPPSLPEGTIIDTKGRVIERDALKDHLRAEVTHGWELLDREGGSSGERTDWAQGIRKTLARALGERHADYFYRAETPKEVPSNTWRGLFFNVATGGPSGQRSWSFVRQRIARLEKIAAQLETGDR